MNQEAIELKEKAIKLFCECCYTNMTPRGCVADKSRCARLNIFKKKLDE